MKHLLGSAVQAAVRIYETMPDGRLWLIANPGDPGRVVHVSRNGAPLVQFERGAIDCNDSEIEASHER